MLRTRKNGGKQGAIANGYGRDCKKNHSLFGVMKIFQNWLWWWLSNLIYLNHWLGHFKWMNFMVCELFLNKANFKNFSLFAMLIRKSLLAHRKWKKKKKSKPGHSLAVQWLGLCAFHCRRHGFDPWLGN